VPTAELVDTAPPGVVHLVEVDLSGQTAEDARDAIARKVKEAAAEGALVFPRLRGELASGSAAELDLAGIARSAGGAADAILWETRELTAPGAAGAGSAEEADVEAGGIAALLEASRPTAPWLDGAGGDRLVRELLRELGAPKAEGESRIDYETARIEGARRLLGVRVERSG